jgi:hypothetical protein
VDEGVGGGDVEEAPKYQCGSACPVASKFGVAAIRTIHSNVTNFMEEEMNRLDATSSEQSSMWLGAISDAIALKSLLEGQLQDVQQQRGQADQHRLEQEFWSREQSATRRPGQTLQIGNHRFALSMIN